ncbi:MAG: PAS domain S-box protein, partial [Proteobacteria bacterium]|nr:PAS domain S-box protein [Pseudomonadota bacterium]
AVERTPDGRIASYQGIVIDITENKRAAERLTHSHDLMRYIIEHTNSAVAVHDRDMRYVYVSQRYLDEYKVRERDVIGKNHYDVFPDLPQKWRDVHRRALAGEVCGADRDPYYRADGTIDWTRWECRPWYTAEGTIGGIVVYTEVITDRVQAEEALIRGEALLNKSQAIGHIGSWELDLATNRLTWSDEAYRIFGLRPQESTPSYEAFLAAVHPDDREMVSAAYSRSVREGGDTYEVQHRLVRHDTGEVRFVLEKGEHVKDAAGSIVRSVGLVQDITEQKRMGDERRKIDVQMREVQKLESLGVLAGGIAHDFNNLLMAILGNADLALCSLSPVSPAREHVEEITRASHRAADLCR